MVMWTTRQDDTNYGYYKGKVCICLKSNVYHRDYDWVTMREFKEPPYCADCGLWANRVMRCVKCEEYYYQFFSHPRMGYHGPPILGWYCWNCLEKYKPPEVSSAAAKNNPKTPPPAVILPPGYTLYVPRRMF